MLEYIFPPFPGDTVTLFGAFLVTHYSWNLPLVFGVVLAGSALGAMGDFYVGVWMGRRYQEGRFLQSPMVRRRVEQVTEAFRRHGEAYIALNRFLPAVRAVFFLAAGMAGLRPTRVLFYALLSAALWNTLIIGVGYMVGTNWEQVRQLFRTYSIVAWSGIGAVLLFLTVRWLVRRRGLKGSDRRE